ncbi:helix-turn-helix domain-containing protein [Tissierella praeacuta]|uniref:helix-turn-helix domain-containing protein n=1 Tax=Tissierella praeacuta TaxID=43131 RepID=UPI001C0F9FB8|nr:helix-turn-helix transcriptional regulator [Tissierella praeacuta]MBU5256818.1 helix-turn-helix domain-containing protein [Tissierella praeacuta]
MRIAENIKKLRVERGLTLRQLASKSELAFGAIGNIERGVIKDPQISTVIKLAKALEVTVAELVEDETA